VWLHGAIGWVRSPGLMEKIMSKTTMHNSKASLEVRELKDELSGEQLEKVSGGKASFKVSGEGAASYHDLNFTHLLDAATPKL
jgi:type VI protein secretion system component Hcp